MRAKSRRRKKIGLALGGGGARGLAHIGVIKTLLQAGIKIDYIAGTSMGALVGGYYAATGDLEVVEHIFSKLRHKDVNPVGKLLWKRNGDMFRNKNAAKKLEAGLAGATFSRCKIPFAAVATDIRNGETVVLNDGRLEDAIRTSISIPVLFQPVRRGKHLLVDGGLSDPVPVDVVRDMGADYVIAVDVTSQWLGFEDESVNWKNMYGFISNLMFVVQYQISRETVKKADIILRPPVLQHDWMDFHHADSIILAGMEETRLNLKRILSQTGYPAPDETPLGKFIDLIRGY